MGEKSVVFRVEGMTCPACERKVERAIAALPEISGATIAADRSRSRVELRAAPGGALPEAGDILRAIEAAGYPASGPLGPDGRAAPSREALTGLGIGGLLGAAWLLADRAGLFSYLPLLDEGLGAVSLVGIGVLTSVHCVGMCGGIVLSQAARGLTLSEAGGSTGSRRPSSPFLARLKPSLLYQSGRILSYTLIGGLAGALGSVLSFSLTAKAILMGLAALFMVLYGLRGMGLGEVLPRRRVAAGGPDGAAAVTADGRRGPSALFARLRDRLGRLGPFAVGLANGLMPCGPLQALQIYALGTGSPALGAASMLLFALGTSPLLLSLGLAAASLPRRLLPLASRASAVLVLVLGLITAGRAAALGGFVLPGSADAGEGDAAVAARLASIPLVPASYRVSGEAPRFDGLAAPGPGAPSIEAPAVPTAGLPSGVIKATIEGGVQTVVTAIGPRSYPPFAVQVGIPVRWIIRAEAKNLNGCNNAIVVPAYKIQQRLKAGDTIVEFTPTKVGTVSFSCWMGMINSRFYVVDSLAAAATAPDSGLAGLGPYLPALPAQYVEAEDWGGDGASKPACCCGLGTVPPAED